MDALYAAVFEKINSRCGLQAVDLPAELAVTRRMLRNVDMRCANWTGTRLRKVYAMRTRIRVPALDIFGMALYPDSGYDAPVLIFDLSCTRKKVVAYINPLQVFDTEEYRDRCCAPFVEIRDRYAPFGNHPMPDWMQAYRTPATVYALPLRERLNDLKACVLAYLDQYLDLLETAPPLPDEEHRACVRQFHERFVFDLTTRDRSQQMLAKVVGKAHARRVFTEVLV